MLALLRSNRQTVGAMSNHTQTQLTLVAPDAWGDFSAPTVQETELAKGLLLKHETLRAALLEDASAFSNAIEARRKVIQEIRHADLNHVERRAVLAYAGYNKVRISEMSRICDLPPKQFDAYIAGAIGFRLALDEARGKVAGVGGFTVKGEPEVVKDLRQVLEAYKGHVPLKGAAQVEIVRNGVSFRLVLRKVRKAKKPAKKSVKKGGNK